MPNPIPYRWRKLWGTKPAASCNVYIIGPDNRRLSVEALIDSGSSVTVVPYSIITALSLEHLGEAPLKRANGKGGLTDFYKGSVNFLGHLYSDHPLYRWNNDWEFVVIGRDIINEHLLTLDGPGQEFIVA